MKLSPLETIPTFRWALKLGPLSAVGKAPMIPLPPPMATARPQVPHADITELLAPHDIAWPLELHVFGFAPMFPRGTEILIPAPVG